MHRWIIALALATLSLQAADSVARDFTIPLPLFASTSPWNQRAEAALAADSEAQILVLWRVLLGDGTTVTPREAVPASPFPFPYVSSGEYSVPIVRAGSGTIASRLRDYEGGERSANDKIAVTNGWTSIPPPASAARPAGPVGRDADGYLVLFDTAASTLWDLWQATTSLHSDGRSAGGGIAETTIHEAGAIDRFDLRDAGTNPPGYASARGVPLLAGLILPEDVECGAIDHALAFAIPGLRNTNTSDPYAPLAADVAWPAATTEGDYINTDPHAIAAGQPIRFRTNLVDEDGSGGKEPHTATYARSNFDVVEPARSTPRRRLVRRGPAVWRPAAGTSWQIQFEGTLDPTVAAELWEIDAFDHDPSAIAALHAQGARVICYINAGAWEDWRSDASQFPASLLGREYAGWPGEKWLDIRRLDLLGPILKARLDLCASKGFDGVDPDNLDGFQQDTGFPLTAQDQIAFNRFLATEAHARGLAIGLKNDFDQASLLENDFDFAVTESCFHYDQCGALQPFLGRGKAVLAIEYTDNGTTLESFCGEAKRLGISAILKNRSLDAWRGACP